MCVCVCAHLHLLIESHRKRRSKFDGFEGSRSFRVWLAVCGETAAEYVLASWYVHILEEDCHIPTNRRAARMELTELNLRSS